MSEEEKEKEEEEEIKIDWKDIPRMYWEELGMSLDGRIENKLLEKRFILLHGELDEGECNDSTRKILYLSAINKQPIYVILNSVGGEMYDGLLVFDTIQSLVRQGIEVTVEARGLAASMGAIVLQAASPGRRFSTPHTRFLIHEISSLTVGKTSEQEEQVSEMKKCNDLLRSILAERTGKRPEDIERIWHKKDFWMSAEEALKFGLIDAIV